MSSCRVCPAILFAAALVQFTNVAQGQNNLALNKPVANSSQGWRKYVKERAVDGDQLQGSRWLSQFARAANAVQEEWLQVDLEKTHTIDKVRIKEPNGEEHYYSSKPPLFTTFVAGGYYAIERTLGWTIDPNDVRTVRWISVPLLFLINILPSALALACLPTMTVVVIALSASSEPSKMLVS